MTNENETNTPKFKLTRNKMIVAGLGAVAIVTSAIAVPAIADSRMYQHAKLAMSDSDRGMVHKASWGGGHKRSNFSTMSDAEIEERVTKMVRHLSIEIDATPEQETKIIEVTFATAKDMQPLRAEFRAAGEEMASLLTAQTVDLAAIENLRAERLVATDEVSKTVVGAIAKVSQILTPEQRKGLAGRLEQFKSMHDN